MILCLELSELIKDRHLEFGGVGVCFFIYPDNISWIILLYGITHTLWDFVPVLMG